MPARILALALAALAWPALADAPPPQGAPAPSSARGVSDDVPPFLHARGIDGPLGFAVSGLRTGYAQVEGGVRVFAVCWQGGGPPYTLTLRDPSADVMIREADIRAPELVEASRPVRLSPGVYSIELRDASGQQADGTFTVLSASPAAAPPQTDLAAAQMLTQAGLVHHFEAYLRIIPEAVSTPGSQADALAATLCHRQ